MKDIADDLELSVRTSRILRQMGIKTLEEFFDVTEKDFLAQPGAGRRSWIEVVDVRTRMTMMHQASRDPSEDVRDRLLQTIDTSGLPPRVILGLLEEIKFIIYARI